MALASFLGGFWFVCNSLQRLVEIRRIVGRLDLTRYLKEPLVAFRVGEFWLFVGFGFHVLRLYHD